MKLKTLSLMTLSIFLTLPACLEKTATVKTDMQKHSYAIGYQIAKNIEMQQIEIDPLALSQAIKDVVAKKKPVITEEEMQTVIRNMSQKRMKDEEEKAKKNVEIGKKFLEENKAKEGIKTTESGLQYKVEKEGEGAVPQKTDTVKVHYKGTLIDGKEFDSSYKRNQPATFPVNAVIPGWTEALQLMKVGSKYKLFIPSELAYGERGTPAIPPNSVLIFEVELLDIEKK